MGGAAFACYKSKGCEKFVPGGLIHSKLESYHLKIGALQSQSLWIRDGAFSGKLLALVLGSNPLLNAALGRLHVGREVVLPVLIGLSVSPAYHVLSFLLDEFLVVDDSRDGVCCETR